MKEPKDVLIVRGDLNSGSGYSRAIEGLVEVLASHFDVVLGVDIHKHPARTLERFEYPIVTDEIVEKALSRATKDGSLVLNVTTPDRFRRFDGFRCVGLFFWETDRINVQRWAAGLALMDEIWVPAAFLRDAVAKAGFKGEIKIVRCPIFPRIASAAGTAPPAVPTFEIGCGHRLIQSVSSFEAVRSRYRTLALSVNTFIPRKGYPVLAREWGELCRERPDCALVLKIGSIDVTESAALLVQRVAAVFSGVNRALGLQNSNVFVVSGNLDEPTMRRLFDNSDVHVTASYGEGFGIGVFDHLLQGKPAVCPRHTSFAELLPADYPYFVEVDLTSFDLPDPIGIVPISARWGVPRYGSVKHSLTRAIDDLRTGNHVTAVSKAAEYFLRAASFDSDAVLRAR